MQTAREAVRDLSRLVRYNSCVGNHLGFPEAERHGPCFRGRSPSRLSDDHDIADQDADRRHAIAGADGRAGILGDHALLPAREQHRRDPPRELPKRPGGPGDEGVAGADGLGPLVRHRRQGGPGPETVSREPRGLRRQAPGRAEQRHPPGRAADGRRPDRPPRPVRRPGRPLLRPGARGQGGPDGVLLRADAAALRLDQAAGRRRDGDEPEEHDRRERPGPADGRVVDALDAVRPARLGGGRLADRARAERPLT